MLYGILITLIPMVQRGHILCISAHRQRICVIGFVASKNLEGSYTLVYTLIDSGFTENNKYVTSSTKNVNRKYTRALSEAASLVISEGVPAYAPENSIAPERARAAVFFKILLFIFKLLSKNEIIMYILIIYY